MAHGALLRQHSGDPEFASHVMHDYKKADLDPQTRGMLDFTAKLTKRASRRGSPALPPTRSGC